MKRERFLEITERYGQLKIAIVGDFCLDRYFEIDPALSEVSIETNLEVHNVVNVRTQPGAGGTILNNLEALGVGEIVPIGFCGSDGEGWLLENALRERRNVCLDHFLRTDERKTFTYSKPLILAPGDVPRELNRLDQKNWTSTPESVSRVLVNSLRSVIHDIDALIVMDQVDLSGTGAVTSSVLECLAELAEEYPGLPMLADSRQGLAHYPSLSFKMNAKELQLMVDSSAPLAKEEILSAVAKLAMAHQRPAFVTLAEQGVIGGAPGVPSCQQPCVPIRGEIDIVGAGDSVTGNLAAALAAKASVPESLEIAMAAASVVVHQLGTTGTATCSEIAEILDC